MPNITVIPTTFAPGNTENELKISGQAFEQSRGHTIGWDAFVDWGSNAQTINAACIQGAIDEYARAEPPIIVTGSDKKTLFCAAT